MSDGGVDVDLHIRCQRCGAEMELRDPARGAAWKPDQFWVCPSCGRHFWSTYPAPNPGVQAGRASPAAGAANREKPKAESSKGESA